MALLTTFIFIFSFGQFFIGRSSLPGFSYHAAILRKADIVGLLLLPTIYLVLLRYLFSGKMTQKSLKRFPSPKLYFLLYNLCLVEFLFLFLGLDFLDLVTCIPLVIICIGSIYDMFLSQSIFSTHERPQGSVPNHPVRQSVG